MVAGQGHRGRPNGKIRLSRRAALKDPEPAAADAEQLTGQPTRTPRSRGRRSRRPGRGTGIAEATGGAVAPLPGLARPSCGAA